MKTAYPKIT